MDPRIRIALKIIEELHGSRSLAPNEYEFLGFSERQFRRLFTIEIGKTLGQYLRDARMIWAAKLLDSSTIPIKEVAHECGYDDISNFYRDFKRVHRTTPQELRLRRLDALCEFKKTMSGEPFSTPMNQGVRKSDAALAHLPSEAADA